MTSIGPYSQPMDYPGIKDGYFTDRKKLDIFEKKYTQGTIMKAIDESSVLKKFRYIVKRSELDTLLDNTELNITIFAPFDNYIDDDVMKYIDRESARRIVLSSMLDKRLTTDIIKSSEILILLSRYVNDKIICSYCDRENSIIINGYINILKSDVLCDNGVIHCVDGLLVKNI